MASFESRALAVTLLLLLALLVPTIRANDNVSTPFFENICNEVECGKGRCEVAPGKPFNFKCECEDGWKRTRLDDDDNNDEDDNLEYLPCTIPNCTLDYSCMPAPPPMPAIPHNTSIFDPCYWIYCGEGTCTRNRTYGHTCQCNSGRSNLLNISAFPCYPDCAINSESCGRLGIRVAATTTDPNSTPSNDNTNKAMTFSLGALNWIVVLVVSTATIFWK